MVVLRLKISRGKALWYLAGQYATLQFPDSTRCRLPIASCPCETGYLEFHFPPSMTHERCLVEQLSKRDKLLIEGPFGHFTVNDATLSARHHVFITADHHFAAVKPMVEHIMATEIDPPCTLLRVSPAPYKHNLCRSWNDAFDWFNYHALTEEKLLADTLTTLRSGSLPLTLYISASTSMITAIESLLHKQGITDSIILDTTLEPKSDWVR